jgi:16S rRNA (uracil1498-N3)-methyltransferase
MLVVVQKATELAAMHIVPVLSERSVPREGLDHEKARAWPKQALRAVRQCRRASLPEVREPSELTSILQAECFTGADLRVYLDADPRVRTLWTTQLRSQDVQDFASSSGWVPRRRLERRGAKHAGGAWGSRPFRLEGALRERRLLYSLV